MVKHSFDDPEFRTLLEDNIPHFAHTMDKLELIKDNEDLHKVIHTAAQPSHDWAASDPQTDFTVNATSDRWLTDACAPLAQVPLDVEPIWDRLAERSAVIGYPIPAVVAAKNAGIQRGLRMPA